MLTTQSPLLTTLSGLVEEEVRAETGELSVEKLEGIRHLLSIHLDITDSQRCHSPNEMAATIYSRCGSTSRDAAERWLRSLSEEERASLTLSHLLMALEADQAEQFSQLARKNEHRMASDGQTHKAFSNR